MFQSSVLFRTVLFALSFSSIQVCFSQDAFVMGTRVDSPARYEVSSWELVQGEVARNLPNLSNISAITLDAAPETVVLECDQGMHLLQNPDVGQVDLLRVVDYSIEKSDNLVRLYEIWLVAKKQGPGYTLVNESLRGIVRSTDDVLNTKIKEWITITGSENGSVKLNYISKLKGEMVETTFTRCPID